MTQLVILTPEELKHLVAEAVSDALVDFQEPAAKPALLDRNNLARALDCSVASIDRLRREGCPSIRLGDVPRFELDKVIEWLKARDK